jgi:hypothetical protein
MEQRPRLGHTVTSAILTIVAIATPAMAMAQQSATLGAMLQMVQAAFPK